MIDADQIDAGSTGRAGTGDPVVIAIVGYRNATDIRGCLSALARSTEKNFQVSICENGGSDSYNALFDSLKSLVDLVEGPPKLIDPRIVGACEGRLQPGGQTVRVYRAKDNLGYAGGINVSIGQLEPAARWSALWILNPDTEPGPQALAALGARSREGQYGLVSSRLVFKATGRVQSYGGRWRPLIARGFNIGMNAPRDAIPDFDAIERRMDYVSGASLFATREYVESVGPMDERYFLYCEEVDWCYRRGHRRLGYAHEALVYHSHGTTIGSSAGRGERSRISVYLDERNKLLFTRRYYPALYPLVLLSTLLLTLQYLMAGAIDNFFVALSGWFAGVRGEEGLPDRFAGRENQ